MTYKENMIIEKWKHISIEEVITIKKASKNVVLLNTEWIMFYSFLFIFMLPAIVILNYNIFVVDLVLYIFVWLFWIKKDINKELCNQAKERIKEMEIILKNR